MAASGTALTTRFMLGAATLMLGTQANALDLLPATASIGLVKDVTLSAEPAFVNLTQGAKNTLVYSMLTMNNVKIAANVFEYTAKNLTYGLSLDGTGISAATAATTTTAAINGGTTPTLIVPMAAFGGAGFADGDTVMIQEPGSEDQILVRTIVSHATLDATVNATIKSNFSSGAIVTKVNTVPLGSTTTPPFLAAKIVGLMADNTPAVVVFPKVRISKGLTMAWNSEQFGSMPFELEVFDLLPADTLYASFPNRKANLYVS